MPPGTAAASRLRRRVPSLQHMQVWAQQQHSKLRDRRRGNLMHCISTPAAGRWATIHRLSIHWHMHCWRVCYGAPNDIVHMCRLCITAAQPDCASIAAGSQCERVSEENPEGTPGACTRLGDIPVTTPLLYCKATAQCTDDEECSGICKTCDPLVACMTNTGAECSTRLELADQTDGLCNSAAQCVTVRVTRS